MTLGRLRVQWLARSSGRPTLFGLDSEGGCRAYSKPDFDSGFRDRPRLSARIQQKGTSRSTTLQNIDSANASNLALELPRAQAELQWIRPPRQARTQMSMERLLDAAEALLGDKRFEEIHVSEIALRAETSVAGFYRRFKDKDALLHALHERLCEEAFATADDVLASERWEGADIADILSVVIPFVIEVLNRHAALDRAIYQRALADELMRERSSRLTRYVVSGMSELLLERSEEIHHQKPQMAVSFALVQAMALLVQHYTVAMREIEPVLMSDQQVALEVAASCLAYLGVRNPNVPPTKIRG